MTENNKQNPAVGYTPQTVSSSDSTRSENGNQIPPVTQDSKQSAPMTPEDFEALKKKLQSVCDALVKKYKFTKFLGLIPQQAMPLIAEEENMPREVEESKPLLMIMGIPEEQYKDAPAIKAEAIKLVKEAKQNIWIMIKTEVDLWGYGHDSKFEMLDAISASYPLYDTGFLGALRVTSIHKTLVLRKFDKYIASYVVGGSLVRGTAGKDSDVDVFVVVDDTDVKRMTRVELLDRLRSMIYDYIREATGLAGVKNILNVQVWLLTDFWQRVKDAEPVAFTFIRDGVALYDRGTFTPWKLLLKMGKIKPSPEAVDMYMKQGEQTAEFVKRRLLDAMVDIYYGIVTPTQAMMMLAGEAPPVPKTIVHEVKTVLVDREKLMSVADLKVLEKAVHLFKQYEYGKLKEFSGTDIDAFIKEGREYNKRLIELRKKLEKRLAEKAAEEVYGNVFKMLETIFGKKSQADLVKEFENKMIKKGKVQPRLSGVLHELVSAKSKIKTGKLDQKEVDHVKKHAADLIDHLVEYAQRADLVQQRKASSLVVNYGGRKAELILLGAENFLIEGQKIKKITPDALVDVTREEFDKSFAQHQGSLNTNVPGWVFETIRKVLGAFELGM